MMEKSLLSQKADGLLSRGCRRRGLLSEGMIAPYSAVIFFRPGMA
jgi:hypothetical protein